MYNLEFITLIYPLGPQSERTFIFNARTQRMEHGEGLLSVNFVVKK